MSISKFIFIASLAVTTLLGGARAESIKPVVVELFTSQGCYSCPAAEKFLGQLKRARGDAVIALEFHVDYWNDLVWGSAGNWEDVHSKPEYTERQRRYSAVRLQGRRGVYTPQMVIGGRYAAVGSSARTVENYIDQLQREPAPLTVRIVFQENSLQVEIDGQVQEGAAVWLANYDLKHTTEVTGGENHGKTLDNYNVVTDLRKIGTWQNGRVQLTVPGVVLDDNQGCAVFVQEERLGQILGAEKCPSG
ncbi:MAG: DUF1223 domain-containing protein [Gammaproteobacteria bacterium]|nr:DUF1223 domain-containing protein [Gammaproteobacteria bacterium]